MAATEVRRSGGLRRFLRSSKTVRRAVGYLRLSDVTLRTLLTPRSIDAWTARVRAHQRLGQAGAALRAADRGLGIDPTSLPLAKLRSASLIETGDLPGALRLWDDLLLRAGTDAARRAAVLALLELGGDDVIAEHLRRGTIDNSPVAELLRLATALFDGRSAPAPSLAAAARRTDDPELRRAVAVRLLATAHGEAAWYVLATAPSSELPRRRRKALVSALSSAERLSDVAEWGHQHVEALDPVARSLLQDALVARGASSYRERAPEDAVAWFRAADVLGRRADILLWIARACRAAGDVAAAHVAAVAAVEAAPESISALVLLADVCHAQDRPGEVKEILGLVREREGPEAAKAEVRILARCGDPLEAFRRFRSLDLNAQDAPLWAEVVRQLRRDGFLDVATAAAEEAARLHAADRRLQRLAASCRSELEVVSGDWSARLAPRPPGSRRGRILHVVGRSQPYWLKGYTVRTHQTVRAQRREGLDAHVVTQLGFPWALGQEVPAIEDIDGVPHHRLAIPPGAPDPLHLAERLAHNAEALADLIDRLRPAALHAASDFRNALVALEVGAVFDIPVVYEVRGFWEETWLANHGEEAAERAWYLLRQEREMEAARRADHVVTLAGPMRDHLVAHGVPADRISIVPNAVEPETFSDVHRDEELARDIRLEPGEVVAGYVSSLNRYEGIDVLLSAIALARQEGAKIRGLVVGDGDDRPRLERHAVDLGISDAVTFTGSVPHGEVAAYYGLIDIFVVPRVDARVCRLVSPLKPYEAMAAGRTVVMSGTPVLRSIVEDGVTGATFRTGDPADLALRLRELAEDETARERIGHAARQAVLREHTWVRNAQRYREIYDRLGAV
jgi:glycosyltransferase involved in cell wall biosynthesis